MAARQPPFKWCVIQFQVLAASWHVPTPLPGQRPLPAVEPKSVEWRGRGERADAIELDSRPLESAFLQHSARSRIAHARAGVERLAAEIVERVIDHGACRFGGVAVAPERNGEPITDLGL